MIFDPSTADHLKPWLTKTLEPICDADPDALADYILALLKHNAPETELRKELASQLEEFLEKEGPPFIDTLFTALRTKSYLPYNTASPPHKPSSQSIDTGIPIPLDALLSANSPTPPQGPRKRGMDYDEDLRPSKGPRVSQDGQFSRYGPPNGRGGHDGRSNGNWRGGGPGRGGYGGGNGMGMDGGGEMGVGMGMGMNGVMGMNGGMSMNGRGNPQYRPPDQRRGICRDYHNNGYCARGAYCKYSHGDDAVVPGVFPMGAPQMQGNMFMPMFPNSAAMPFPMSGPATYDPHESRLDIRPAPGGPGMGGRPPRPPVLPRVRGENGDSQATRHHTSGELPVIQDLTPRDPKDETAPSPNASGPVAGPSGNGMTNGIPSLHTSPASGSPATNMDVDVAMDGPSIPTPSPQRGFRPTRGRGGGGRPGFFSGEVQSFRPERRNDKTLVVEKIPDDKLSLDSVNGWFKKFGTVTNVAIDPSSAKALVSFSTHEEAHAAWKSEDAVFGNRFVKLFWHRPMEGHGQTGQRMLAASAPLVASVSARDHTPAASTSTPQASSVEPTSPAPAASPVAHVRKPSGSPRPAISALAAKQQLLEQQIAEQKSLMEKLGTASAEEKKELFARLRKLGQEMKGESASTPPPAAVAAAAAKRKASTTPRPDDREEKEKARLDKELEMHSVVSAIDGEDESTEALKAKLEKLKAEAASLGIDANSGAPFTPPPYRGGYRGRGRGASRGYARGALRGGPPRGSMKLDNRPRKLVVKDVDSDAMQAVRDWYESTGQVDSIETLESGDVVVSFTTRMGAEQGLAKGSNIPMAGHKQISWYTPSSAHPPATKASSPLARAPEGTMDPHADDSYSLSDARDQPDITQPSHVVDEEYTASGWGGDEDEDGMGML
ncbi:hypothetical protein BV25DRAFT_1911750 [Artomyces pyxidatus]|uniref:Uncharacterized protein n=1 Tax=Artomyces pyxidatus TaxID=48021 RepID=A0ACB8THG5_9AGAM|nr:hypothetical protein BV25DRAFT_1911750 [Artomyces pyxidatus]